MWCEDHKQPPYIASLWNWTLIICATLKTTRTMPTLHCTTTALVMGQHFHDTNGFLQCASATTLIASYGRSSNRKHRLTYFRCGSVHKKITRWSVQSVSQCILLSLSSTFIAAFFVNSCSSFVIAIVNNWQNKDEKHNMLWQHESQRSWHTKRQFWVHSAPTNRIRTQQMNTILSHVIQTNQPPWAYSGPTRFSIQSNQLMSLCHKHTKCWSDRL